MKKQKKVIMECPSCGATYQDVSIKNCEECKTGLMRRVVG